ncbi:actin-binding protein anillin-like [Fopius arisanus]|uniref:Actin-binding protein anillin-like n=1 Tax=Fopius arisanus TaxID=64838 RepID=A0A9R1UC48_9HYME|nr:PREDICTED: actin-binding protein anillin-like [Fopius arisanus]
MTEWAEVTIENINLSLRERLGRESLSEPMEWFLVVIIEGTNVWGTSLGLRPVGSMLFEFSQFRCIIDHLKPGFNITIEIYSLNLKSKVFCNDEDRSHTLNSTLNRTWTYLSPTKFFRRSERSPKVDPNQKLLSSSFIKSGHLQLGLNDLTLSSPWTLTAAPHDSILRDIIDLNLSCVLHLSASHEGFLNFGEPSGDFISWNRRFCALKGCTLMFWNYPRDQETKPPLKIIDLAQCCSQKISEVDKELCTRSQTVVLEVPRSREPGDVDSLLVQCKQTHTVQRYLLSYDNKKELIDWSSKLNNVLSTLRNWNVSSMKSIRISPAAASHQTEILRQLGSV